AGHVQPLRRCVADPEAFAGRLQALAQQAIGRHLQIQTQSRTAAPPAPQAEQRQQESRQQAIDQYHADQPAGPALPRAFEIVGEGSAGAYLVDVRHAETEQRRQRTEGLGQPDEGPLAEDGGFPDEAVAPRGEQRQQGQQGAAHGQQPKPMYAQPQQPAPEAALLQHRQQGRRQLHGAGIAGELLAEPEPQPAQRAAAVAGQKEAQQPAEQCQQIQSQQAAQGPEHVDRPLAIAQRRPGEAGPGKQREQRQCEAGQPSALSPMSQGIDQPITTGQPQRAIFDQLGELTALRPGPAIGLVILQRPGVLFAQAHGFGQPEAVEGGQWW